MHLLPISFTMLEPQQHAHLFNTILNLFWDLLLLTTIDNGLFMTSGFLNLGFMTLCTNLRRRSLSHHSVWFSCSLYTNKRCPRSLTMRWKRNGWCISKPCASNILESTRWSVKESAQIGVWWDTPAVPRGSVKAGACCWNISCLWQRLWMEWHQFGLLKSKEHGTDLWFYTMSESQENGQCSRKIYIMRLPSPSLPW